MLLKYLLSSFLIKLRSLKPIECLATNEIYYMVFCNLKFSEENM